MGFGNLDRRIDLNVGSYTKLTNGEDVVSWSLELSCWAAIDYGAAKGEKEDYEADQLTASNTVMFKVRYYPGITEKMMIGYGDVDYTNTTPLGTSMIRLSRSYGDISDRFVIGSQVQLNGGTCDGEIVTITHTGTFEGDTTLTVTPATTCLDYTSITALRQTVYDILHIAEVDRQRYLILKAEKKD